jgi:YHS domain-containing protein
MIGKTMTAARHPQKLCLAAPARAAIAALLLLAPAGGPVLRAATTEQIVSDVHTGFAIYGFDPVAYFVAGTASPGQDGFEYSFAGVAWRFCNDGNRSAFILEPQAYMPQFGGYDPVGVARGVAVAGDPRLWLIVRERLYLFQSAETRRVFAGNEEYVITSAERMWGSVQATLSP